MEGDTQDSVEVVGCKLRVTAGHQKTQAFPGPGSWEASFSPLRPRGYIRAIMEATIRYVGQCQVQLISGHCVLPDTFYRGSVISNYPQKPILSLPDFGNESAEYDVCVFFRRKPGCKCAECTTRAGVPSSLKSLSSHLNELFDSSEHADVVFEIQSDEPVEAPRKEKKKCWKLQSAESAETASTAAAAALAPTTREIKAHKVILCARVPYFKRLFESGMQEATSGRIRIEDAEAKYFQQVLRFVYTGQLPEDLAENPEIYVPIADKYGIEELKAASSVAAKKSLKKENIVQTLIMADLHLCGDLKKECISRLKGWKTEMGDTAMDPLAQYPQLMLELLKKF